MTKHKNESINSIKNSGFTLIELLIALAISGILMVAVYSMFQTQQDSYLAQDQVVATQQNIRAASFMLINEIRMAAYDPTGRADSRISSATVSSLSFTKDDNANMVTTDANENITFGFAVADDANSDGIIDDLNGDGIINDMASLRRDTGGGLQPLAENIESVEFNYIMDDGTTSTAVAEPTTTAGTAATAAITVKTLDDIRAVQISILSRAENPDPKFTNNRTYTTGSGAIWGPFNDNFRRRFQISTVKLRNMGR